MSFSWVRPKQAPDDEIEVFSLGEPEAEDDTGDVLEGRYELIRVLACGGTATVYRARDLTTKSPVAVKVLFKGALAAVGDFFNQEARLAARIRSPHLVHASHFGEDDGRPFIVFDLVSGDALSELYDGKLMPWRELCLVVLDLLAGLSELHRRGITHRDVKPDNVFVQRLLGDQLHAMLLDMGFAAVPPERRLTGAPEPSRKVFGTFGFIAPEMLAGALPEPRCDIYSVGALMYTMLTSQQVPDLRAAPELLCIPSPRMLVPTLPPAVDALVMRALSDVDARFQNVAEMAAAIQTALSLPDALQRDVLAPPITAPAEPTPRTPVSPLDEGMRPFRDSTPAATSLPDVHTPAMATAPMTSAPRLVRPHAHSRLAAAALTGGLLGAAVMWGFTVERVPPPQVTASGPVSDAPSSTFAESSATSPTASPPAPSSAPSAPSPTSSTPSPTPLAAAPASRAAGPKAPVAVIASIHPRHSSPKTADEPRPARTFAEIMAGLEPKIRECARKTGLADGPATVQVRSDPRSRAIDSVRVLRMSSEHPFAACAEKIVRQAALPADISPIEDFTFFKTRGQAAK